MCVHLVFRELSCTVWVCVCLITGVVYSPLQVCMWRRSFDFTHIDSALLSRCQLSNLNCMFFGVMSRIMSSRQALSPEFLLPGTTGRRVYGVESRTATRHGVPRLCLWLKMCLFAVQSGVRDAVMKRLTHALMGFPDPSSFPHTVQHAEAGAS